MRDRIKELPGENVNNLGYAEDTVIFTESLRYLPNLVQRFNDVSTELH